MLEVTTNPTRPPRLCLAGGQLGEALANVREAIELYIDGLRADGLAVPEPRARVATVEVKAA